jgi:hypothetical protein
LFPRIIKRGGTTNADALFFQNITYRLHASWNRKEKLRIYLSRLSESILFALHLTVFPRPSFFKQKRPQKALQQAIWGLTNFQVFSPLSIGAFFDILNSKKLVDYLG